MKNYFNILTLFVLQFFLFSCEKTIDFEKEEENFTLVVDKLVYKGENFTGTVIRRYPKSNDLFYKYEVKDGLFTGRQIRYFEGGIIQYDNEYTGRQAYHYYHDMKHMNKEWAKQP
jgi:hypothetical protein